VIGIGSLEALFNDGKVFVLCERFVTVGIRGIQLSHRQTAAKFVPIKGSVVVTVEAIKHGGGSLFGFRKVNRAIIVRIESIERTA